jgi:dienelactone hydrolase
VLGILGCLLFVPTIGGLVCAIFAFVKIKQSQGALRGRGVAVAGVIVSCIALLIFGALARFWWKHPGQSNSESTLAEARRGFTTELARQQRTGYPVPEPPADLKQVVYRSPAGEMAAYLSRVPDDGRKHPAIIWITGGFSNSIGESAWEPAKESNDQSARFFRQAGVVTFYPSLRGGNENPGFNETFFGEVDDVLAAAEFLASQPGIDPHRIYLGGHSTGGTLALLVAESNPRFRAVFAFGPIARVASYGDKYLTFNVEKLGETDLRSPVSWLHAIRTPTYVMEGEDGNADSLRTLKRASKNAAIKFYEVPGKDHFSILAPYSRLIAKQIIADTGGTPNFSF